MDSITDGINPEKLARFKSELAAAGKVPAVYPDALKEAVCDVVDDMKGAGKRPEEVIIEIRQICLDAGITSGQYTSGQNSRGVYGLVDKIISSCIERYYE